MIHGANDRRREQYTSLLRMHKPYSSVVVGLTTRLILFKLRIKFSFHNIMSSTHLRAITGWKNLIQVSEHRRRGLHEASVADVSKSISHVVNQQVSLIQSNHQFKLSRQLLEIQIFGNLAWIKLYKKNTVTSMMLKSNLHDS